MGRGFLKKLHSSFFVFFFFFVCWYCRSHAFIGHATIFCSVVIFFHKHIYVLLASLERGFNFFVIRCTSNV
jgi:hypothetical protein